MGSDAALHKEFPHHQHLAVHLPNEQLIYFDAGDDPMDIIGRSHETTLTAWFAKNAQDPRARTLLYPDFPEQYVYDKPRCSVCCCYEKRREVRETFFYSKEECPS